MVPFNFLFFFKNNADFQLGFVRKCSKCHINITFFLRCLWLLARIIIINWHGRHAFNAGGSGSAPKIARAHSGSRALSQRNRSLSRIVSRYVHLAPTPLASCSLHLAFAHPTQDRNRHHHRHYKHRIICIQCPCPSSNLPRRSPN